ncbi:M23 family metallopeptidase [Spirosoma oryzicola]|uniref:M23 family metallopeptidase n=1 Tax=Spirosoma oryzicola TaxID=2898794 RepID=UPI001E4531B6|nr:M23 family metallopeptidase [Spirosoma oryzicola]UHG94699.1 M23 family metallopeptidase [Spirosoma oryzicola]
MLKKTSLLLVFGTLFAFNLSEAQDSLASKRDSMEVLLLRTAQNYGQFIRIVKAMPANSPHLSLLPSVLPINIPVEDFRVVSGFGLRLHPLLKKKRLHAGVDVKAVAGTSVKATATGYVSQAGYDHELGAFVRIQHAFGFETIYGHLEGYCVKTGQCVELNEEIGRVGNTGLSTGAHLHYAIKKNGSAIDPFQFCYLLRYRLWLYQIDKPIASGILD